jgi:hypothetical protein
MTRRLTRRRGLPRLSIPVVPNQARSTWFAEVRIVPMRRICAARHATTPDTTITYALRHWDRLTLFLHQPGAPLDSNIVECALKSAILHRKNSLFYETEHGPRWVTCI